MPKDRPVKALCLKLFPFQSIWERFSLCKVYKAITRQISRIQVKSAKIWFKFGIEKIIKPKKN